MLACLLHFDDLFVTEGAGFAPGKMQGAGADFLQCRPPEVSILTKRRRNHHVTSTKEQDSDDRQKN